MRAHGGDIDVWSQPGVGSSFTLSFPLAEQDQSAGGRKGAKSRKAAKSGKSGKKNRAGAASASAKPQKKTTGRKAAK